MTPVGLGGRALTPVGLGGRALTPVGVVLAGGRSRRMDGRSKAAIAVAGRPMLAYVLEALTPVLGEVAVAAKPSTELPGRVSDDGLLHLPGVAPVALWTEPEEPQHPLAGLCCALRRAAGRAVLVCAVDLPLVTSALVQDIADTDAQGAPAVVPSSGERLQPLLARYEAEALVPLQRADADVSLTAAVQALRPRVIEPADPELFVNVNRPQDIALAEAELRRARRTR